MDQESDLSVKELLEEVRLLKKVIELEESRQYAIFNSNMDITSTNVSHFSIYH
jgi:hypothetical protein